MKVFLLGFFFIQLANSGYIRENKYFDGWEYNKKKITNFAGDLYEPLILDSDITLNPIFRSYVVDEEYKMGYIRTKEIFDDSLITELDSITSKNNITTPFFYQNKIYDNENGVFYENEEVEYVYMGEYEEQSNYVGGKTFRSLFISKKVLFYDYATNKDAIIAQMKARDNLYRDSNYTLPYDYIAEKDFPSNYIHSALKSFDTKEYLQKYFSVLDISNHLENTSIDSFLIANSQFDTSLKVLNNQGNVSVANANEKYGYRICLERTTGLLSFFETWEF